MIKRVKLGDIAEITVGYVGIMKSEYVSSGIPFFRSLNVNPYSIDESDLLYISEEFSEKIRKSELHEDDLVIVRTGKPGTCSRVPPKFDGANCSDLVIVRPDKNKVDVAYIEAYINHFAQKQISNQKVGAVQQHFNITAAKEMVLYLPELSAQKRIGSIVQTLNNKIANNNAINAELEALAKTIYDYWFLQFEFPNEEGLPYKSSGGRMVWSEELKREIPEGWCVEKLGDIVRNSSTSISARKAKPYPYTPLEKIPSFKMSFGDFFDGENAKTSLLYYEKSAILFGSMRPYFHRVCIAPFSGVTRTTTFVLYPTLENTLGYAYETLNQNHVVKYATNSSVGTQQPYVEWANSLEDFKIPHVPDKLKIQYSSLVQNMIELVIKNEIESHSLSELRDWLLPMLMNGQVGFKDTE